MRPRARARVCTRERTALKDRRRPFSGWLLNVSNLDTFARLCCVPLLALIVTPKV